MHLPAWLAEVLTSALYLSHWQELGLAFLLGSFTVATLSDLKYLAAQREFLEVWLLFVVGVFFFEAYDVHRGRGTAIALLVKWGLITALSVASHRRGGWLFRLAPGDVAALAAAASLLPPPLILLFYLVAKLCSWPLAPVLSRGRAHYPFMPVVSLATLTVLSVGLLLASMRP